MEEETIEAFVFHQHPLRRIPKLPAGARNWCGGCMRFFLPGDAIYGCSRSDCGDYFHQECLEMPREIRHHVHTSHTLTLRRYSHVIGECAVCEWGPYLYGGTVYSCSGGCEVWIHKECAWGFEDVAVEKHPPMEHPSHPQHPLRFSKKTVQCSFPCDACGISSDKRNSYICSICDYWIHDSCASLPASAPFPHHLNHSLSLAFHPPHEYIRYEFECAICRTTLRFRSWVYHCQLCRYVVHIKCATDTSLVAPSNSSNNENAIDDEKNVIRGPIADIYGETIRPFIKRERGEIIIPHEEDGKYKVHNHHHLLNFTRFSTRSSSSSSHDHNEKEEQEEKEEDDDDDDGDNIPRLELICDGCTLPIHEKKQASSSTSCSYDEYDNGYMSCDECKYFLHLACFNLPLELPSLPFHPFKDHKLTLQNSAKLTYWEYCHICHSYTNGLFYVCTNNRCFFQIDIKCASLPNTIKHAGHPQHHHYLKLVTDNHNSGFCGACYSVERLYRCDSCNFCMCGGCVLLPAHNTHRLENHPLLLTYDAYRYHSGDFYCGSCEVQMNPKEWMYHCQECDQSFHTKCFPAMSGQYRNINFGRQQYVITTIHHSNHLLRFQIISKKKLCDLCHRDTYDEPGFQCASCNFVMCLEPCSVKHINNFKAID